MRGASNSTSAASGIVNKSAMLFWPPVYLLVFLDSKQHMRWVSSIRDENGTSFGSSLCSARVLIELSAG